jgi:hypothetical protein
MEFASFYQRFPHIAAQETRVITIFENSGVPLPPGEYGLLEFYCTTSNCDCRRTFLNVVTKNTNRVQAVISYGWESREFYARWFGSDDREIIDDLKGPALAVGHIQSGIASQILDMVTKLVLTDQDYIDRLKRHYQMFKASKPSSAQRAQRPLRKQGKVKL